MVEEREKRRNLLREVLQNKRADAALLTHLPDVRYYSGFSGSAGALLVTLTKEFLFTDGRYRLQSAREAPGVEVMICDEGLAPALGDVVGREGVSCIAYDPGYISHGEWGQLRSRLRGRARFVPLPGKLSASRAVKDAKELSSIKRAIRASEEALLATLARDSLLDFRECEVVAELEREMRARGAEDRSFPTIVLSGSRSALPHGRGTSRKLKGARVLLVDWGAIYKGYCADLTRTIWLGEPHPRLKRALDVVLEAQERALEKIRPGMKAAELDGVARRCIEGRGFGRYISHSLGHGVGLEVHERPYLSQRSEDVLKEGMVFTLEPGIYLPGLGGVRVEEMVRCTARGPELLSTLPRVIRL